MKVLFLYTELSLYIEKCFEKLVENNYKLLVFRYPVNKEAPFKFNEDSRINYITYTPQSPGLLMNAIEHFSPELVFCSGWKNLFYLKVAKKYKEIKVPVVLCFDNNWNGSCRQFLATALLKRFFAKRFTFAWVPGSNQREFAIRLGFNEECIQTGFYTADIVFFQKIYFKRSKLTQQNFPKRFIYIGRYVSLKGIEDLWIAFKLFSEKFPDWELWCFGTGNLSPVAHPKIKHFGFKQPAELYSLLLDGGVFVLPSRFEPWGVIVHEMAAAGFPLLLSDEVGAAEAFLTINENGFNFEANNIQSCQGALEKMASKSNLELKEMGHKSYASSNSISTETWFNKVKKFLN